MTNVDELYCEMIARHYGEETQTNKLLEELAELIRAIARGDRENIVEEVADVEIMVYQYKLLLGLEEDVDKMIVEKIKRQTERIKLERTLPFDCMGV